MDEKLVSKKEPVQSKPVESRSVESKPVVLSKASMKRLLRIILRANKKLNPSNIKKTILNKEDNHHSLESDIYAIKEKLKKRADVNKVIQEQKKKEFFEKKQAEKVVEEEKEKIFEIQNKDYASQNLETASNIDDIEKKKLELANKRKKELEEIKTVLHSLEDKHKSLQGKKHDPVTIIRLEEKINLLKRRISHIENE